VGKKRPNYRGDEAQAKKARKDGFAARSVYKLEELDSRFHLLRRGGAVLDLGAAPGSWSQYALRKVGRGGLVVAVDRREIDAAGLPGAVIIQGSAFQLTEEEIREAGAGDRAPPFDAVVSDMAPNTTGVPFSDHIASVELCDRALQAAEDWLKPGGSFVCKVFQGVDEPGLRGRIKARFDKVKAVRPKGTRTSSVEIFVVATGFRGAPTL
jgi:23S rRNA (uridine2552-2'-O)-methyltransferase